MANFSSTIADRMDDAAGSGKEVQFIANGKTYEFTPQGLSEYITLAAAQGIVVGDNGVTVNNSLQVKDTPEQSVGPNIGLVTLKSIGSQAKFGAVSEGQASGFTAVAYRNSNLGSSNEFAKARGTIDSPTVVQSNDQILRLSGLAYDGSNFRTSMDIIATVSDPSPSSTAMGGRLEIKMPANGATVLTSVASFEANNGMSLMGVGNVVIDQNRHFRLRFYLVSGLPDATIAAGQVIYCSNLGGGGGELVSDGTKWRRASGGGYQIVNTDANFTLTPLTNAEEQRHTGTLTADRTITLGTTNAYVGARFRVTRTGSGAFNLSIGGLKNLVTNSWAEVVYDGTAWYLAAYGTL